MEKLIFLFLPALWVGWVFVKTRSPCQIGPYKRGRSMRKGRRRRRRRDEVWLPVLGGPIDGGSVRLCRDTEKGFHYITDNGAIYVYQYTLMPTEHEGVYDCHFKHTEIR